MGKQERIILIKGDATKWYNQAIFIVNQDTPQENIPTDFVAEAERIINNYMYTKTGSPPPSQTAGTIGGKSPSGSYPTSVGKPTAGATAAANAAVASPPANPAAKNKKKRNKTDTILNILMILACLAIAAVFAYGMISLP